jgi:LysR family hydrogen peroxide-inducible transcriptional activator
MMLAIYQDHPWANRDRVPMSDLAGEKLLMLEDGHCLRDQAMGFCFEAGAMKTPTSGRPVWKRCVIWWLRAAVLRCCRRWRYRVSVCVMVVYLPCIKPEPRRTIGLVYRPGSPLRSRYEQLAEAIRGAMDGHFDSALKQAV